MGSDAGLLEAVGHEVGVVDADAEAERSHLGGVADLVSDGGDHLGGPDVVAGVDVGQFRDVVPLATPPRDTGQVGGVVDAEVVERREQALLECVPETQLDGDAVAEPAQHVESVGSFGGGGEAEQVLRAEVVEQGLVAGGGGVVELVDDDDVELFGVERCRFVGVDRLD